MKTKTLQPLICLFTLLTCQTVWAVSLMHTTDALSIARKTRATSVGTLALFAGGSYANGSGISRVDIYDTATGQWATAELSVARSGMATASAGTKAVFAGGCVLDGTGTEVALDAVDIYDAATGQWSTATLSQAREGLTATALGNEIFFAGGLVTPDTWVTMSNVVDIYDVTTGQWRTATLTVARDDLSSTTVGQKVFFAGGSEDDILHIDSDVVDIYDAQTGLWSTASLSAARSNLTATTVGDKAIFAGGVLSGPGGPYSTPTVDIYDDATGQWSTGVLSEGRWNVAAVTLGDLALFAGGLIDRDTPSDVVDIYDASTGLWSTTTLSEAREIRDGGTTVGDTAFFGGGVYGDPGGHSDRVDIYQVPEPATVLLDIKPGSDPNSVNLNSKGVLPVVAYGSEGLDLTEIDLDTLLLNGVGPRVKPDGSWHVSFEDVDGDLLLDLLMHFEMQALGIEPGMTELALTGELMDGTELQGADAIRIVPDFNGDLMVNATDLGIMSTNFGQTGFGWTSGDANNDGLVNATDLGILSTYFGLGEGGEAIPEPATLSLLALGGLALLRRGKKIASHPHN